MKKRFLFFLFGILFLCSVLAITLQDNIAITGEVTIDPTYLNELKEQSKVECLQNSQCSEDKECVENRCIKKEIIDLCKEEKLFTPVRRISIGQPINIIKEAVTDTELPYLLSDGLITEEIDGELIEHFYTQVIWIDDNKVEKQENIHLLKIGYQADDFAYKLKITFSKPVDFSSKNIQGQILRILGKEYAISGSSTGSVIHLTATDKTKIKLKNGEGLKKGEGVLLGSVKGTAVNIMEDSEGKVIMFEILFNEQGKDKNNLLVTEEYIDPAFDAIKLSFNKIYDENFVDARVGGNC